MDSIMIQVAEEYGENGYHWSEGDGLTIAAPATTRKEALMIYNKFIEGSITLPLE